MKQKQILAERSQKKRNVRRVVKDTGKRGMNRNWRRSLTDKPDHINTSGITAKTKIILAFDRLWKNALHSGNIWVHLACFMVTVVVVNVVILKTYKGVNAGKCYGLDGTLCTSVIVKDIDCTPDKCIYCNTSMA